LKSWLANRTREQLAELLEQRDLPQAAGYGNRGLTTLGQLAEHLLTARLALRDSVCRHPHRREAGD
jgi:hypothetical protein